MGISTFNPDMRVFIAQKPGKWSAISCSFAFSAAFCPLFLSFHLFLCFQLPSNIMVYRFFRRGFILEPPGLKERVPSLGSFFLIEPPPSLQHCMHLAVNPFGYLSREKFTISSETFAWNNHSLRLPENSEEELKNEVKRITECHQYHVLIFPPSEWLPAGWSTVWCGTPQTGPLRHWLSLLI